MDKLIAQIHRHFPVEENLMQIKTEVDLLETLSLYIQELIDTNFNHLVNILYRVDVSEKALKKSLSLSDPKDASRVIAELIIEREKEKLKTREAYKNSK